MSNITRKQKKLADDIKDLIDSRGLNIEHILKDKDSNARTAMLESAKDQIIRGEIIFDYTLIDEAMNAIIRDFFFGKVYKTNNKHTDVFDKGILEKIFLLDKLDLVREVCKVPRYVNEFVSAINGIRNGMAHSLILEELHKNKPVYKKKSLYKKEGMEIYSEDLDKVIDFFTEKAWGIKRSEWSK